MEPQLNNENHFDNIYYSEQYSKPFSMPLVAFSDLEGQKHKKLLEKQYTGARANGEQKLYGVSVINS